MQEKTIFTNGNLEVREVRGEDNYVIYKTLEKGAFRLGVLIKDTTETLIFGPAPEVGLSIKALKEVTALLEYLEMHKHKLKNIAG